jgi:hypothetical protein
MRHCGGDVPGLHQRGPLHLRQPAVQHSPAARAVPVHDRLLRQSWGVPPGRFEHPVRVPRKHLPRLHTTRRRGVREPTVHDRGRCGLGRGLQRGELPVGLLRLRRRLPARRDEPCVRRVWHQLPELPPDQRALFQSAVRDAARRGDGVQHGQLRWVLRSAGQLRRRRRRHAVRRRGKTLHRLHDARRPMPGECVHGDRRRNALFADLSGVLRRQWKLP